MEPSVICLAALNRLDSSDAHGKTTSALDANDPVVASNGIVSIIVIRTILLGL